MTTRAQMESNRRNAKKSTGPKTERGKSIARSNALKDGLTGRGFVVTLADETELAKRVPEFQELYRPRSADEQVLVRRMALESIRMERCHHEEVDLRREEVRKAVLLWAEERSAETARLGATLGANPSVVARELHRSLFGCLWLYERWVHLRDVLETHDDWDDSERSLALDLLGVDHVLRRPGMTPLDAPGREFDPNAAGDFHFALADKEIAYLVDLIDGPLSDLDREQQRRVATDRALHDNPKIVRLRQADQRAFSSFLKLRRILGGQEKEQAAAAAGSMADFDWREQVRNTFRPTVEPTPEPAPVAATESTPPPAEPTVEVRAVPLPTASNVREGAKLSPKRLHELEKQAKKRKARGRR